MRIASALALAMVLAAVALPVPANALQKKAMPINDVDSGDWNAGATCRVRYYNTCTGWVWCWDGGADGERLGMVVESCCPGGQSASLLQSMFFICSSAPCAYADFTGTVAIHAVDGNDCPIEPPIAIQPYCPFYISFPFSTVFWGKTAVPHRFAIVITMDVPPGLESVKFATDHPAAGPTGPLACGFCYPVNRPNHSFNYGTLASPNCPGSPLNDGTCDAQLFWDVDFACTVSVEETSWGRIKELYR